MYVCKNEMTDLNDLTHLIPSQVHVCIEFTYKASSHIYHSDVHLDSWSIAKSMAEMKWDIAYFKVGREKGGERDGTKR